jgi:hypothetical protein
VALPDKARVYLIDQPGAVQANIVAAQLLPSSKDPGTVDMEFANAVFGGDFTARLNMNLREDKHWSYGTYSGAGNALGQRLWTASAPVQIDKTIESIQEMRKEIGDFASGSRPVDAEEVARLQAINIRTLPGSYETARAVLGTIGSINRYGRPDDFVTWRKGRIEAMTPAGVQQVADRRPPSRALTWIVVGDRSKIEAGHPQARPGRGHRDRRRRQGGEMIARPGFRRRRCCGAARRRQRLQLRADGAGRRGRARGRARPVAGRCVKRGKVEVSVEGPPRPLFPDELRVKDELEVLARNEAPGLEADTIQPKGPPVGRQASASWPTAAARQPAPARSASRRQRRRTRRKRRP